MTRERHVEQALVKFAKKLGLPLVKLTGHTGIPDRLLILPDGRTIFIECKRPGETVKRDSQINWKNRLASWNQEYRIVNHTSQIPPLFQELVPNLFDQLEDTKKVVTKTRSSKEVKSKGKVPKGLLIPLQQNVVVKTKNMFRGYQDKTMLQMLIKAHIGAYLDPGLGKTATTLAAMTWLSRWANIETLLKQETLSNLPKNPVHKIILVAPKRVTETVWHEEAEEWDFAKGNHTFWNANGDSIRLSLLHWLYQPIEDGKCSWLMIGTSNIKRIEQYLGLRSGAKPWISRINPEIKSKEAAEYLKEVLEIRKNWVAMDARYQPTYITWPEHIPPVLKGTILSQLSLATLDQIIEALRLIVANKDIYPLPYTQAIKIDALIIDELSIWRNPSSSNYRSLHRLAKVSERVIGLTGTFFTSGLVDVWAMQNLVEGNSTERAFSPNRTLYLEEYFDIKLIPVTDVTNIKEYVPKQYALENIVNQIKARGNYILLKQEQAGVLPPHVTHEIRISLTKEQRKALDTLKDSVNVTEDVWLNLLDEDDNAMRHEYVASTAADKIQKLRQVYHGLHKIDNTFYRIEGANPRLDAAEELWESIDRRQLLIFTRFDGDDALLRERFGSLNARVAPDTSNESQAIWNSGGYDIFLGKPAEFGHGINLQKSKCEDLLWYTSVASGDLTVQGIGRIKRPGGAKLIREHRIIDNGHIDRRSWNKVEQALMLAENGEKMLKEANTAN